MELNRRFIQGRLSEVLGEKVINVDKQMRLLGLYEAASDIFHLSSTTFSYLKYQMVLMLQYPLIDIHYH